MIAMAEDLRFEDIRRSTPEQEAEHKRWAKLVLRGASLRELRELKGKTQAQIGEALGVTQVQAGRIEKGGEEMQLSTLRRYLDALGLELEGVQVRDRERDYIIVLVKLGGPEESQGRQGRARRKTARATANPRRAKQSAR
jgi:transcriptional regulator with XRE-family HTH domain